MENKFATYLDLLNYLKTLEATSDDRLYDNLTVYLDGEYYPAEFLEFEGDDIICDGSIFISVI